MLGKFRLRGSKLFITYSQAKGNKEDLLAFLDSKVPVDEYVIAKELHKDGGTHFHCYLGLNKSIDIKNPRFFDWNTQHPKFEVAKSASRVCRYAKKDGDFITNMTFDIFERARNLAKVGDIKGALNIILEEQPREIVNLARWEKGFSLVARLKHICITNNKNYKFKPLSGIDLWSRHQKVLILHGESGLGKTQFAKSLFKNPLLVRHIDKLKKFDSFQHDGIIFDDMSFQHWPRESCIHLLDLDEDADINVKCSMVTIPAGVPRVITSNYKPYDIFSAFDKAIRRRHYSIEVKEDIREMLAGCNVMPALVDESNDSHNLNYEIM